MGCDIHPVVQVRKGDKWETVDLTTGPMRRDDPDPQYHYPLIESRSYAVFSALGNVRNFWGEDGETKMPFIQNRRGYPADFEVDDDYHPHGQRYGRPGMFMGDHSHGWVTLAELEAYPWADNPMPESVAWFARDILPWLRTLGAPEDVRMVFGFDS